MKKNKKSLPDLQKLARYAKQGDKGALEELLQHPDIIGTIYGVAYKMVGCDQSEDIRQEVCHLIAQNIHAWRECGKITSWMRRITVNCCLELREKTKQERDLLHHQYQWSLLKRRQEQQICPQVRYVIAQERWEIVRRTLEQIDCPCRQILTYHIFERMNKHEIMARLDIKKTTFYATWKVCCENFTRKIRCALYDSYKR